VHALGSEAKVSNTPSFSVQGAPLLGARDKEVKCGQALIFLDLRSHQAYANVSAQIIIIHRAASGVSALLNSDQ
jgi:hypothetical protein